jgi:hypothetical protein
VAPDYVAGLRAPTRPLSFATIRNVETIASELRLIAAVRRTAAEIGAPNAASLHAGRLCRLFRSDVVAVHLVERVASMGDQERSEPGWWECLRNGGT